MASAMKTTAPHSKPRKWARNPERPHAIAEHVDGRDIEERVTDDDRERPLDQGGQMVSQDGRQRNVDPPVLPGALNAGVSSSETRT